MKYVIGLFAALVIAGVAVFMLQKPPAPPKSDKPTQEEIDQSVMSDALLWTVVKPKQVAVVSSALTPGDADAPVSYAGKFRNSSDKVIDKVALRIRLYDCQGNAPGNWNKCTVVDDDTQNIEVKIGPKETVSVAGRFQFHHVRDVSDKFSIRPEINRVHIAAAAQTN